MQLKIKMAASTDLNSAVCVVMGILMCTVYVLYDSVLYEWQRHLDSDSHLDFKYRPVCERESDFSSRDIRAMSHPCYMHS